MAAPVGVVAPTNGAAVAGRETSLSAKPSAAGLAGVGAPASAPDEVMGIGTDGDVGALPVNADVAGEAGLSGGCAALDVTGLAVAKLLDDGDVAGVRPATATASGFDWAEGRAGLAERASADESSGAGSCFHQANRGAVWQPAIDARIQTNIKNRIAFVFINAQTRVRGASHGRDTPTTIRHGWAVTFTETRPFRRGMRPVVCQHWCSFPRVHAAPLSGDYRVVVRAVNGSWLLAGVPVRRLPAKGPRRKYHLACAPDGYAVAGGGIQNTLLVRPRERQRVRARYEG